MRYMYGHKTTRSVRHQFFVVRVSVHRTQLLKRTNDLINCLSTFCVQYICKNVVWVPTRHRKHFSNYRSNNLHPHHRRVIYVNHIILIRQNIVLIQYSNSHDHRKLENNSQQKPLSQFIMTEFPPLQ